MKSAVASNIFATEDVSIATGDRNARRVQSLQVLIKIIRSYSAEILRLTLLFPFDPKWGEIVKGCRCSQAGENTHCGRVDRVLPTIARQFQSSTQHRVFRNRAAEE